MQGHSSVAYRAIRKPLGDENSTKKQLYMPGRAVCTPDGTCSCSRCREEVFERVNHVIKLGGKLTKWIVTGHKDLESPPKSDSCQ